MFSKRCIAGFITLGLIGNPSFTQAAFQDIENSYAKESIVFLAEQGVLYGMQTHTYGPKEVVTRKQFAVMLAKAIGIQPSHPVTPSYSDLPITDWSYGYLEALTQLGVVKGLNGQFDGDSSITREEAALMVHQSLGLNQQTALQLSSVTYKDEGEIAPYAIEAVNSLSHFGIMKGNQGYFSPKLSLTREQMAILGKQVFDRHQTKAENKDWAATPFTIELKPGEQTTIEITTAGHNAFSPVYGFDHPEIGQVTTSGLFTAKAPGKGFLSVTLGNHTQFILVKVTE
ncbi:S-layer homology domain-containing protein [Ammoniphilus sp. CFH 90114]|uniref:S-layer homology domain-containing protein n=1 Tax=Ammoniphilus sp. CFH 90114 TaxID=2493665 RepID=UPI00100F4479|nr:S-layer homology domain-containing protein [Ammoniphilus sp. CFH 90114]RXT15379.1 S-layer homology domain-containing protein [Ammoniphilus sp. CFH 90114]